MNTKTNHKILIALLLLMYCNISQAKFLRPEPVPVDRLISNAAAYVREHPRDANGYYILARINYLAFANKSEEVPAFNEGRDIPPKIAESWQTAGFSFDRELRERAAQVVTRQMGFSSPDFIPPNRKEEFNNLYNKKLNELRRQHWLEEQYNQSELLRHLIAAFDNFKRAIELDPKNGLYHLGFASLLEQYVEYIRTIDLRVIPVEIQNILLDRAAEAYYTAYELSIKTDMKNETIPLAGLQSLTAYEAGNAYIRLMESKYNISEEQKKRLNEIKENIKKLNKLPMGAITPLIFSLETVAYASELLERNLQVRFDLDGDGAPELRPWVKPTTGILVWNQDGKGEIASGRQLFGSVTWWLFFKDGYHALDCLDDNRDGALSSSELTGISAWFDTNSNGKSEKTEIKTLEELGIVSISTKSTETENGWPTNKTGITLMSGKTIPTYDWIASPDS
jgi:hypothetical protein